MKRSIVLVVFLFSFLTTFANHIAGGELFYEYVGQGGSPNTSQYKVTMRLLRDCHSTGQTLETERVIIGVYSTKGLSLYSQVSLALHYPIQSISLNTNTIPCLTNAPEVCFQIGLFTGTVDLPTTPDGFTLSWIRCCRADNIRNLAVATGIGGTFVTRIPGSDNMPAGHNSSPQFVIKDTALVCQNKNFVLDFGASDADHDSLSYSFCDAYEGGTTSNPNPSATPEGPPRSLDLESLPYATGFSGDNPLGAAVSINPRSGKITGVAPAAGRYVINVCVAEWRNGTMINQHRKDFILEVGNCNFAAAEPIPMSGAYCTDFKVDFSNNSTSADIQSYYWDFGVKNSTADTSISPTPEFTYPDTGTYTIKLVVKGARGCVDTGITKLGIYPGFNPDFDFKGLCYRSPFLFIDKSTTKYGYINSWKWNFGDATSASDISTSKNPSYQYSDTGTKSVTLVVTSSKGCTDSIVKPVKVTEEPFLQLPFKDTLICRIDTLKLKADGNGSFTWKPNYNIINSTSATPQVYPKTTTTYAVTLTEDGCVKTDSIRVNVLDSITVDAGPDVSICTNDTVQLNPISQGLQYQWSPTEQIKGDPKMKNAIAAPTQTTMYTVTANLGNCQAKDNIRIAVAPYPKVNAGTDVTICYGKEAVLSASTDGSSFIWSPTASLSDPNTLTPVARPAFTTNYILTGYDTLGCPKPSSDTVVVTVMPPINAFAGSDTSIVVNQPLQLNASGGTSYTWSPATGLDNPYIANPVVLLNSSYDSITYTVRVGESAGCFADDDIKVKVFKTAPDIFIPTAFTPNHDGKNDFLRPIAVGIKDIKSFKVFNRWGQLLFSSIVNGLGWDGTFGGMDQPSGTYVFMAEGVDYLGKTIFKKGTVILIR
jgi:gliding motility-associated-like protein